MNYQEIPLTKNRQAVVCYEPQDYRPRNGRSSAGQAKW